MKASTLRPKRLFLFHIIFSNKALDDLIGYFLHALNVSLDWVIPDILNALSTVLYLNVEQLSKFWDTLVGPGGTLIRLNDSSKVDSDMKIAVLRCLQNICIRKSNGPYLNEDHVVPCLAIFLEVLQQGIKYDMESTDIFKLKVLLTSLHGVRNILIGYKKVPGNSLGEVLGIMRALTFIGLQSGASLKYTCLFPAPVSQGMPHLKEDCSHSSQNMKQNSPQEKNLQSKKRVRKKRINSQKIEKSGTVKAENILSLDYERNEHDNLVQDDSRYLNLSWLCSSSSDSEYSDSENSHSMKIRSMKAKIRCCSYKVLHATNWICEKKVMFGYWSSFLPNIPGPSTALQEQTLLVTILKDPSVQVRAAALSFLTDLLDGSKLFLAVADENVPLRASFISMSFTLAEVIRELHRSLLNALSADNSSNLITTPILKCYARLVENVNYQRFKPDLLANLLDQLDGYLYHRDVQVQVAALTLLESIVRVEHQNDKIEAFLFTRSTSKIKTSEEVWERCWLVEFCSNNVQSGNRTPKLPTPILIETIQLLSTFLFNYHKKLTPFLRQIKEIILHCMQDSDSSIQLHGTKAFDVLGKVLLERRTLVIQSKIVEKDVLLKDVEIWRDFLSGPLTNLIQNPTNHPIHALCCDCLSNIGDSVFQLLPHHLQATCITMLLSLINDENANVRGAAVRCLGIYTLYPSMQDTFTFLMDVGEAIIVLLDDSNNNTCLKASWALGNLSDSLVMKRDDILEFIPSTFISSLGLAALKASKGQDKVKIRTNTVRAIGNLLSYIPLSSLENPDIILFIKDSVALLLSCLGKSTMKVQWNACYALGTMLKNKELLQQGIINMEEILRCLILTIRSSNNFKVQINATSSLTVLSERSFYGNCFLDIWVCLLETLTVFLKSVDYKERAHRDGLCEQVMISIARMIALLQLEDVIILNETILSSVELLLQVGEKVGQHISQDKIEIFSFAELHLKQLESTLSSGSFESDIYSSLGLMELVIATLLSSRESHSLK